MILPEIATPAALIDEARMMRNIARMQARMDGLGVRLRPHVKTSKCVEVAMRQKAAGARGITVSTLKEAEQFAAAGFEDIFYAVGMSPHKLERAAALHRRGCALTLLVDSVEAARATAEASQGEAAPFTVMIEVDTDGHRSGVQPESEELIAIGEALHRGGALLKGVMTHAGSSYALSDADALRALAEQERRGCVRAAERLRQAGLPCAEVSVGSTPTALSADHLAGVTEVRAGVYVFFDLVMANVGVCTTADIALSVLTTVIGHQREKGWAIVDAGWMAMSRDRGTQRQRRDFGYGLVCDAAGVPIDGFLIHAANQEHGIVSCDEGRDDPDIRERFPIGTKLRILPNHACATAAQFPAYRLLTPDRVHLCERFYGW